MIRKLVCLAAVLLLGLTTNAFAGDWAIWQGNVDDNYANPANWVDSAGNPLGHMPHMDTDNCTGIGRSFGGTYWPVLYDNPLPGWGPFSALTGLFAMTEWDGVSNLTFEGGYMGFKENAYMIIGRKTGDTATVTVNSGGIGGIYNDLLYYPTRWLRIGEADTPANGGGLGTMVMNGGTVYAQSVTVGNGQGLGDAGCSLTVNDGAELYVGCDFFDASFDVGPTGTMTINPGGFAKLYAEVLVGDFMTKENARVWAKGALNLVADGSDTARLVIPVVVDSVAQLESYFGYYDGETFVPGNINAVYNGGAGQFVFSHPYQGMWTEVTVIPEPATIALLGIGGLCLLRRKRS
jgi:hypothetical protein